MFKFLSFYHLMPFDCIVKLFRYVCLLVAYVVDNFILIDDWHHLKNDLSQKKKRKRNYFDKVENIYLIGTSCNGDQK